MKVPVAIAENGTFLSSRTDHHPLATFNLPNRLSFGPGYPILDHVIRIVLVFSDIIPCSAFDFFSVNGKEIRPRVFSSGNPVARHHGRYGSKRDAVAAIPGGHKLVFGIFANVRQTVRRTDYLS